MFLFHSEKIINKNSNICCSFFLNFPCLYYKYIYYRFEHWINCVVLTRSDSGIYTIYVKHYSIMMMHNLFKNMHALSHALLTYTHLTQLSFSIYFYLVTESECLENVMFSSRGWLRSEEHTRKKNLIWELFAHSYHKIQSGDLNHIGTYAYGEFHWWRPVVASSTWKFNLDFYFWNIMMHFCFGCLVTSYDMHNLSSKWSQGYIQISV